MYTNEYLDVKGPKCVKELRILYENKDAYFIVKIAWEKPSSMRV